MTTQYCYTDSPLGKLLLVGDFHGLSIINFQSGPKPLLPESGWRKDAAFFVNAILQLDEYFAGQRQRFSLRINPQGSDFQREVLAAVARIPYGQTASYKDIARIVRKPKSTRAVGSANRNNPLPIVIPCHRVLGANGKLTGFAGGIATKQWLLDLERGLHAAAEPVGEAPPAECAGEVLDKASDTVASESPAVAAQREALA